MWLLRLVHKMICAALCQHCRAGRLAVQRLDTLEFTHSFYVGRVYTHCMCEADKFRKWWPIKEEEHD